MVISEAEFVLFISKSICISKVEHLIFKIVSATFDRVGRIFIRLNKFYCFHEWELS